MAATDPQPPDPPPDPPANPASESEPACFEAGERVRWRAFTGTIVIHRGVAYVLFDHHRDPPAAAYAVTKLARIAPVRRLEEGGGGREAAGSR
jgi:hypothetical protein